MTETEVDIRDDAPAPTDEELEEMQVPMGFEQIMAVMDTIIELRECHDRMDDDEPLDLKDTADV